MKYFEIKENKIVAYYDSDIHEEDTIKKGKPLTEELYNLLLTLSCPMVIKELPEVEEYNIEHFEYFSDTECETIVSDTLSPIEEKVSKLEDENLDLKEIIAIVSEENDEKITNLENENLDLKEVIAIISEENDTKISSLEEENLSLKEIIATVSEENDTKISSLESENLELKEIIALISEENDAKILDLQMAIAEIFEGGII